MVVISMRMDFGLHDPRKDARDLFIFIPMLETYKVTDFLRNIQSKNLHRFHLGDNPFYYPYCSNNNRLNEL